MCAPRFPLQRYCQVDALGQMWLIHTTTALRFSGIFDEGGQHRG
jgi:hypothetical protein